MAGDFLRTIKRRLEHYKSYLVARELKWAFEKSLKPELKGPDFRVASLKPEGTPQGNVLISYVIDPFFLADGQPVNNTHSHYWESLQMAKTFLELGYCVDVINYQNLDFQPEKEYVVLIDSRFNLQRLAPVMHRHCAKIMHIDAAHMLYHNAAEARRLLELQQRRGVTLRPRRWEMPNLGIEHADCATILGNQFTMSTFRYANKPLYRVPVSVPTLYPWPKGKDFHTCRKNYLWFGSGGMVHKGLDFVLEVFAAMPDYHLTVCGPVQAEEDFVAAYHKELFAAPNIRTVGWVDVDSPQFVEICNSCVGLVYPSCSEGGGGSVIQCMHAGLIPIVSYESSVDILEEYGVLLKESSVEQIRNSVTRVSSLPQRELERMAHNTWDFARRNHTRERFAEEYRKVVSKILNVANREDLGRPVQDSF
jgi:glycosyltransferase involved in cell wall biosynthesis